MAISVFQNFGFLPLKFQKYVYLENNPKIQNFQIKKRNICYSATSRLPVCKISSQ